MQNFNHKFDIHNVEVTVGNQTIKLETGLIAKQSDGAVVATMGETMVLATAVSTKEQKPGISDFTPLTVNYKERTYAAGKIPGGFFKREGRASKKETLSSRIIDRTIRPIFPEGFACETNVTAMVISSDDKHDADVLSVFASSAALVISSIPFNEPVAAVRIGRKDGNIHPWAQITRGEVATIYFRMLTDEARNKYWSTSNPYPDVAPNTWCNNAISTMTNAGVVQGYKDGLFRQNAPITRGEFAAMAARFFNVEYSGPDKFSDIDDHWAKDYINKAAEAGIILGYKDGTFQPERYISRAEAILIFNRVLERHPDKDHLLDDMITWPDNMDPDEFFYADVQEATNSHDYEIKKDPGGETYEVWTKLQPVRDWAAFENEWATANAASNPGNVYSSSKSTVN